MSSRTVYLLLVALFVSCVVADARSLTALNNIVDGEIPRESKLSLTITNGKFCKLCEEFASEAIFYLGVNETQIEIINTLHHACSKVKYLEEQCIALVDYYAPLFFKKTASLSPEQFCESVNLCDTVIFIRLPTRDDACTLCHQVVEEILTSLKDQDMELDIIEILLKGCTNVENFVQQCKKLIIQNAPVIIEHMKKVLEAKDFCGSIRACEASKVNMGAKAIAAA